MKFLALAGFVVAALSVALWLLVVRDSAPATADATTPPRESAPTQPAASAPAGEAQARTQNVAQQLKRQVGPAAKPAQPAPTLSSPESAGSAAKERTPDVAFRYRLIAQVKQTEPAIIDCLEMAKKAGAPVDGVSAFGVYMVKKGDQLVYDGVTFEYGPYGAELNQCIHASARQMAVEAEAVPEGIERLVLYRKLTVENGEIMNLQMPELRVTDGARATPP